jgi:hypothetical protein
VGENDLVLPVLVLPSISARGGTTAVGVYEEKRPAMAGTTGQAMPPPQALKALEELRSAGPPVSVLWRNAFASRQRKRRTD